MIYVIGMCVAGVFSWTFLEYAIHNWLGHLGKGKNEFSREHLRHHAEGDYFAPTLKKLKVAGVITAFLTPVMMFALGYYGGGAFVFGLMSMYTAYEVIHRRCHTHPPRGWYSRWARKHHFYHHFKRPHHNHGVTTPIWDFVFGTYTKPERIVVPRKLAMVWLLDENGEVHEDFREDYGVSRKKNRRSKKSKTSPQPEAELSVAA